MGAGGAPASAGSGGAFAPAMNGPGAGAGAGPGAPPLGPASDWAASPADEQLWSEPSGRDRAGSFGAGEALPVAGGLDPDSTEEPDAEEQRRPRRRRRRIGSLRTAFQLLVAGALAVDADLFFGAYFSGTSWLRPVMIAAAAGLVTGATLGWSRLPGELVALLAAIGAAPVLLYSVFAHRTNAGMPSMDLLRDLADAAGHGWNRMLTMGLPQDPTPQLLALPVLLAWIGAVGATILVQRSRMVLLPMLPPFAVFVMALLLTAPMNAFRLQVTAGLVGLSALLAFLRSGESIAVEAPGSRQEVVAPQTRDAIGETPMVRSAVLSRAVLGIPALALICTLALVVAWLNPFVEGKNRYDLREHRTVSPRVMSGLSPLSEVKPELTTNPARSLFSGRLRVEAGAPVPDRLRLATLDRFDGVTWASGDRFVPPSTRIEPPMAIDRPAQVSLEVTVDGLEGRWLPTVGEPLHITGAGIGVGVASSSLISDAADPSGLQYAVSGVISADASAENAKLDDAVPGGGAVTQPLPITDVLDDLRGYADRITSGKTSAYGKLVALQRYVKSVSKYSIQAPPGESYAAALAMLQSVDPYKSTFAAQRASTFAILARAEGLPVRVVVGYKLSHLAPDGSFTVTTADVDAWPEALLSGVGWVAFPVVSNQNESKTPPTSQPGVIPSRSPQIVPPPQTDVDKGLAGSAAGSLGEVGRRAVSGLLMLVVALVLCLAVIWLLKVIRRRRRRHAGSPAARLAGAWAEMTDRLTEAGLHPARSATPSEIADELADRVGFEVAAPVGEVSPLLSTAAFAPWPPEPSDAVAAWTLERRLRRALARQSRTLRWRRPIDPRPLLPSRARRSRLAVFDARARGQSSGSTREVAAAVRRASGGKGTRKA